MKFTSLHQVIDQMVPADHTLLIRTRLPGESQSFVVATFCQNVFDDLGDLERVLRIFQMLLYAPFYLAGLFCFPIYFGWVDGLRRAIDVESCRKAPGGLAGWLRISRKKAQAQGL